MSYTAVAVKLTPKDRETLESWLRTPTISQALAMRARVLIASAAGEGVRPLAARLEISPNTVSVWRKRYREARLAGLQTRSRPGRPRRISDAKERAIVAATMRPPEAATHWSARRLAKKVAVSSASVRRIWHEDERSHDEEQCERDSSARGMDSQRVHGVWSRPRRE